MPKYNRPFQKPLATSYIPTTYNRFNPESYSSRPSSSYQPAKPFYPEQESMQKEELGAWQHGVDKSSGTSSVNYEEMSVSEQKQEGLDQEPDEQVGERLRALEESNRKLQASLEAEAERRQSLEQENNELKKKEVNVLREENTMFRQSIDELRTNLTASEERVGELETIRQGYQEEMKKKVAKIEELHNVERDLKTKLHSTEQELNAKLQSVEQGLNTKFFELNLEMEDEKFIQGDFLSEEPIPPSAGCARCGLLRQQLKGSNKKLQDLGTCTQALCDIRLRFLISKDGGRGLDRAIWQGNTVAHCGNILVDVFLFISGYFNREEHAEMFFRLYNRSIDIFLDPKFDFDALRKMPKVCDIINARATMAHQDSFTKNTANFGIDRSFEDLDKAFDILWNRYIESGKMERLESLPEVTDIHKEMECLSTSIVKLGTSRRKKKGKGPNKSPLSSSDSSGYQGDGSSH
ncbi:hypothetical protein HYFRA_00002759 [Hymenoscyphus fraxineus]|uniref:Uncharacterized protein n=1 Tax=Hymenoscyphus fraxineus TaxID=746836 RepID=A0A9N9KP49_9HELO|nr:hypothetical protein HYFRA_00002759 [Hymenoscyphus fraxineus]